MTRPATQKPTPVHYLVHWLPDGTHTPGQVTRADSEGDCRAAVRGLALAHARRFPQAESAPDDFADRVEADTMAELATLEPGRADDPFAPSVTVSFPVRVRCGAVFAQPCLVVVPVAPVERFG